MSIIKIFSQILLICIILTLFWFFIISSSTGLNFALKMNFLANFLAPVVGYLIIKTVGISGSSDYLFVSVFTFIIVYVIAVLTCMKASADACENRTNVYSASYNGLKIAIISMMMYFAVLVSPILQAPFEGVVDTIKPVDPKQYMYTIIGFYMAFISLTGTVIAYFPSREEGCAMTDQQILQQYQKDLFPNPTVSSVSQASPQLGGNVKSSINVLSSGSCTSGTVGVTKAVPGTTKVINTITTRPVVSTTTTKI